VDIVSSVETCYRHPSRETGVSCSSCGRPICPECMTPTPVGMRCPECSRQRTKVKTAATITRGEEPVVTYILMGICVALGIGSMLSPGNWLSGGFTQLDLDFSLIGAKVADGEVYRLVTAGFLHAGIFHLLVNMYSLWILGSLLEPTMGRVRFLVVYFAGLLAGSFGGLLEQGPLDYGVGASTAIFGLMGAALVVLRKRGIDPMQSGLPLWIGINLVLTFTVSGLSVGGHVGGLIGGTLAALLMYELPDRVRSLPAVAGVVLAGCVGVAAFAAGIAVA
jgi:membrane associated rhomboid family serine protease